MHDNKVTACPFCGSKYFSASVEWSAQSLEPMDSSNIINLEEIICRNDDCSRSFWV